ncbi:MAG: tetraacyldisaccharide 4'-kinase [Gemmatimonadetes bacterium]|nr:tetraacyldisaccharide 4'-kinase [Gemmatimonadota bacterium]
MSVVQRANGRAEARIRRAWTGRPGVALRLASAAYEAAAGARNLMYDAGVFASVQAPIPVVSIGGLTVGGSGKTPIAADVAARLSAAGVRTAILTHGFDDEMNVHRQLAPKARVYGARDREALAHRAAEEGADIAILDSGFQRRRLHRDLDVVTLDEHSLVDNPAHLPAGPFREGMAALRRADLVVVVRRHSEDEESLAGRDIKPADGFDLRLQALQEVDGAPPFVSARIVPGSLVAANELALETHTPRPSLAVAGIMWPDLFFAQAGRLSGLEPQTVGLPDHSRIDRALSQRLRGMAGDSGIVCTLKDSMKLVSALGDAVPIWYLSENVVWEGSGTEPSIVRSCLGLLEPRAPDERSLLP